MPGDEFGRRRHRFVRLVEGHVKEERLVRLPGALSFEPADGLARRDPATVTLERAGGLAVADVVTGEAHALLRQTIQMRRPDARVTVAGEVAPAQVVAEKHEEVRA